jgi:hypothetical protein
MVHRLAMVLTSLPQTSDLKTIQKRTSVAIPHPVKTTMTHGPTESRLALVKRNSAFASKRHLIYGAPPHGYPLWSLTSPFVFDLDVATYLYCEAMTMYILHGDYLAM